MDPHESEGQTDPAEEFDARTVAVVGEIAPELVVHRVEVPAEPAPVWAPVPLRMMPAEGVSSAMSATSHPLSGEPRTVPYHVYAHLGRENDMLVDQVLELRRVVDQLTSPTEPREPPGFERKG